MFSARNLVIAFVFLLPTGILAAGCGSSGGAGDGTHPDYERALAGAPAPLAALYREANEVLPGGIDAYEARIVELKGHPVVANVWASWCGPCRYEFPSLQNLSARYGKRVAFLGVNSEDSDGEAERFLAEDPVPYPSYSDGDKDIFDSVGAIGLPDTVFYDSGGELCGRKIGAYADEEAMEADIERFALQEDCESG
jgi:cytochrome c biogenesis protein CcmG, thiol:disulfide interchange protein DsbE